MVSCQQYQARKSSSYVQNLEVIHSAQWCVENKIMLPSISNMPRVLCCIAFMTFIVLPSSGSGASNDLAKDPPLARVPSIQKWQFRMPLSAAQPTWMTQCNTQTTSILAKDFFKKRKPDCVVLISYPCSKTGDGHIDFQMLEWTKPFQHICDWLKPYTVQLFLADCASHLFHLYMQWHSHNFLLWHINTRLWVVYSSNPC